MVKVNIPTVKLNNGREIPALGYGTWLGLDEKANFLTKEVPKLVEALSYAIDIGYRHIDTAHVYRVEPEVGHVVNTKINEGVVKREDLFITTKGRRIISDKENIPPRQMYACMGGPVGTDYVWQHYHREQDVEVAVRASLKRMNLDYLDLILIHWPMSISEDGVDEKIDYLETWRGFESVLAKELVKSIGVSNFNLEQLKRLLANCKVPPVINQVEINLNLGQKELVDYCQSQNIVVVGYSPFGSMVPSRPAPNSPEPKLNNPTMNEIAKKHGKTVTQIVLRYLYQRGIVSIPKTVTKSRVLENASIFDFELDSNDVSKMAEFDVGYRLVTPAFWQDFTNYPFDINPDNQMKVVPLCLMKWKNGANSDIE